ncbi:MAG: hydantoinase/oxoprolinase family protein [Albidovulum sp.]|nr:hydantoinase/oxoprolinase family protein [Albidovulum sp.]
MYVGVDVGGTFTDFAVNPGDGSNLLLHKVASTPDAPERAIIAGLVEIFSNSELDPSGVRLLAHGTTVGTNALIQRRCGKVALVTSLGFKDLLEIGRQTRPTVYDMHSDHPAPLTERRLRKEVPQRRLADGTAHVPLDESAVVRVAKELAAENVDCVAVCFLHSYAFPEDEKKAKELLQQNLPSGVKVIASSSVYPEFREFERFSTTVLNGALLTVVGSYLDRLCAKVARIGVDSEIKIGQSSGHLMSVRMAREFPVRASLSGPAAGVQGANRRAAAAGFDNIITLDVGGTSADVSILIGGRAVEINDRDLAGFPIKFPSLDVNAVGAGGGSIAWVGKDGLLKVGPRSAGALPGPACYDLGGGEATVTDANVLLGRLNREALLGGRMPVKPSLADAAVARLADDLGVAVEEAALGIIRVACAAMVKAIRSISIERGHDPREFSLFVYGGAGGLHATDVARDLGIREVVVPTSPGILCAEGVLNSFLAADFVTTVLTGLNSDGMKKVRRAFSDLGARMDDWFIREDVPEARRRANWTIAARYFGQNFEIPLPVDPSLENAELFKELIVSFHAAHADSYGFASETEPIQLVNVSAKAVALRERPPLPEAAGGRESAAVGERQTMFDEGGFIATPIFERSRLVAGQRIKGPAIIEQMDATIPIFPGCRCRVDSYGNLVMKIDE